MVKKWTDDFGTVHYGTQAPREFRVGDEVETLDGRRGVVLSVACAGIYVVYVGFQDGVYEWYSRDGRAPLRHSADNPGNIRHRHPAAPETDVEAVIADVLAAHEAGRAEDAYGKRRAYDMIGMAARSLGPIKAALAGTPPTSDARTRALEEAAMIVEGWPTAVNYMPFGMTYEHIDFITQRDLAMGKAIRALIKPEGGK